jgi:predicted DNA-binding ribbon-helix-helix protein
MSSKYMLGQMRGIVARDGHFRSLKLETCFWHALRYLAIGQGISLQMLLHQVEGNTAPSNRWPRRCAPTHSRRCWCP